MRLRLIAAFTLLTLVGSGVAMAYSLVRTRNWVAQSIPNGNNALPVNGVNLPARASVGEVSLSRENWPVDGVDISIELTFDNGATWEECAPPNHIDHGVPDPRTGVLYPAKIGCTWNPDRRASPDAGRLRVSNPDGAFTSDITVNFYNTDQ